MKSILIGLLILTWTHSSECYSQTDTTYCIPISKARLLVADALRLRLADSIVQNKSARIVLLENEKEVYHQSFSNLLNLSEQKFQKQKEITSDMERLANGWREEAEYFQKRVRKERRWKKIFGFGFGAKVGYDLIKAIF